MPAINWLTKVITVAQAELTLVSGTLYELDVNDFRLALKNIEDSEEGMAFSQTHRHNTQVVLSGVTYARTFEILPPYTLTFEDTGSPYTVRCSGANHNLADVTNFTSEVSLIVGNSAGLITAGSGVTAQDKVDIAASVWLRVIEAGFNAEAILRIIAAHAAGEGVGLEGVNPQFKGLDGTTVRIDGTYVSGNRTIDNLNGS
jgi:hypothetical protein